MPCDGSYTNNYFETRRVNVRHATGKNKAVFRTTLNYKLYLIAEPTVFSKVKAIS